MIIKRYIFRIFIALATFVFGVSLYFVWLYFQANFSSQNPDPVISLPSSEPQNIFSDVSPNISPESELDVSGYYYIKGKAPKGFEDFEYIGIQSESYVLGSQYFGMKYLKIENDQISFATEVNGNLSYQFDGRIVAHENLSLETVVLKGRLTKIRKGRKVAESDIGFTWYEGH